MLETIHDAAAQAEVFVHHGIDGSADGENRQPVGERQQCQNRQPEVRHREKKQGDRAQDVVDDRAASRYLHQCDDDAERKAGDERHSHQQQSIGQSGGEDFAHGKIVRE